MLRLMLSSSVILFIIYWDLRNCWYRATIGKWAGMDVPYSCTAAKSERQLTWVIIWTVLALIVVFGWMYVEAGARARRHKRMQNAANRRLAAERARKATPVAYPAQPTQTVVKYVHTPAPAAPAPPPIRQPVSPQVAAPSADDCVIGDFLLED